MTEAEWLDCSNVFTMLDFVRGKASQRGLRLFLCACCRNHWQWLSDERSCRAVELAERFADGLATLQELMEAGRAASSAQVPYRLDPSHHSSRSAQAEELARDNASVLAILAATPELHGYDYHSAVFKGTGAE
jgi:hypothetical protein